MRDFSFCNSRTVVAVLLIVFTSFLSFSSNAAAQETRCSDALVVFEKFVNDLMESTKTPGVSVAFFKDDFVWSRGFGYADLENKTPVKAESAYRLASVSKSMTALAIVKLAVEGKLDLDADVRDYVPYFPEKKWPVTVRQLLGHLGGVSHYRDYGKEGFFTSHYNTRASIGVFKDWELEAEPGTKYIYSSYGYNLLGAAVEGASGKPFGEYLTENIWKPLGMNSTVMDNPDAIIANRVRGYRLSEKDVKNSKFVDISSRFAAGGTRSTVLDLLSYARGVMNTEIVPREAQHEMFDSMVTKDGHYTNYGMGWRTRPYSGYWIISHSGGQHETSTYLLVFPWENFAVAVAGNLEGSRTGLIAEALGFLVMGAYDAPFETGSPAGDKIHEGLSGVWSFGLGYLNRYGEPLTTDRDELITAFKYFNESFVRVELEKDPEVAFKKAREGFHPLTGTPMIKVGAYIAHRLGEKHGKKKVDYYRTAGCLPFFRDYIILYREDGSIPEQFHLAGELETMVMDWASSWELVWTDEVRGLLLRTGGGLEGVAPRLKEIFAGAAVYPRFNAQLNSYAYYLKDREQIDKGLEVLLTAAELYPSDANLLDSIGEFYKEKKDNENAIKYYTLALEKDPDFVNPAFALAKLKAPEPDQQAMDALVGKYRLTALLTAVVSTEEKKLYAQLSGFPRLEMVPKSDKEFVISDGRNIYELSFIKNKEGEVTKVQVLLTFGKR